MTSKAPPKASKILATPIENVEDSRAQRLQLQQSRFRDRGGRVIFVPSSRNRLANILLGKASPVKKLSRRSTSTSPSKGRGKATTPAQSLVPDTPIVELKCRRSSRKQMKDVSVTSDDGKLTGSCISKPATKASSRAGSKTSIGPPRETIDDDTAPAKSRKRAPLKGPYSSRAKTHGEDSIQCIESAEEDKDEVIVKNDKKSSSKGRTRAKAKPQFSGSTGSKSAATTSPARPARARRKAGSKSGNEGVPKVSRSKKKSSSGKSTSQSKSKRGVPQLPDIMEEDEDDLADDQRTTPKSKSLPEDSKDLSAPLTGKKRAIETVDPSAESPERPQKRAKPARTELESMPKAKATAKAKPGKTKGSGALSKPKVSKRRRTPKQDADEELSIHGGDVTAAKRKTANEDRSSNKRPVQGGKRKKVETETETEGEADSARGMPTKTAKRKENTTTKLTSSNPKEVIKLPPRRGLPKSVLLRIQNSSAPHVIDDEPDPIDFLSTPRRRLYV